MKAYLLSFRDLPIGGSVTGGQLSPFADATSYSLGGTLTEFWSYTSGKRVLFLLHGFNNSWDEGKSKLGKYIHMLEKEGLADVMVIVLWPGDGELGPLTYPFEGPMADDTGDSLHSWIMKNVPRTATIGFVAHSLGSRAVMRAVKKYAENGTKEPLLDRICLMAPAMHNDSLVNDTDTDYRPATLASDKVAVLASKEDLVLHYAFPPGDRAEIWLSRFSAKRRRKDKSVTALGRSGPVGHEKVPAVEAKTQFVPVADPGWRVGHGDYLPKPSPSAAQTNTHSESEKFISAFFRKDGNPVWPAQGTGNPATDEEARESSSWLLGDPWMIP